MTYKYIIYNSARESPADVETGTRHGRTVDTAVYDGQKLVIAARVAKEFRVDCERTAMTTAARLTERVLYVEVTVAGERHSTSCRAHRVVSSVPRPLEHQHRRTPIHAAATAAASAGG